MEKLYSREYAIAQSRQFPPSHLRKMDAALSIRPTDRVLEIGSGNGSLLSILKTRSNNVVGLDINPLVEDHPLVIGDGRHLPFRGGAFDVVISSHTLEHIDDLQTVFEEIDRVTKPGGKGFHLFPANVFTKAEGAIFDAIRMYGPNIAKAWREAHKMHIHSLNPRKVQSFIQGTNLSLVGATRFFVPETFGTNYAGLLEKG